MKRLIALVGFAVVGLTSSVHAQLVTLPSDRVPPHVLSRESALSFDLVPSAGALACLPDAHGEARLTSRGSLDQLDVVVSGLPARTKFTLFVLQIPHAPFGLAWYQGDVETDQRGVGRLRVLGIFNDETFIVAPGVADAPIVHAADAEANPQTAPIHTFHLGMWFDAPGDAVAAGCSGNQTPFNGEHTAGIQVLNTTNFPDNDGPIGQFGR